METEFAKKEPTQICGHLLNYAPEVVCHGQWGCRQGCWWGVDEGSRALESAQQEGRSRVPQAYYLEGRVVEQGQTQRLEAFLVAINVDLRMGQ